MLYYSMFILITYFDGIEIGELPRADRFIRISGGYTKHKMCIAVLNIITQKSMNPV